MSISGWGAGLALTLRNIGRGLLEGAGLASFTGRHPIVSTAPCAGQRRALDLSKGSVGGPSVDMNDHDRDCLVSILWSMDTTQGIGMGRSASTGSPLLAVTRYRYGKIPAAVPSTPPSMIKSEAGPIKRAWRWAPTEFSRSLKGAALMVLCVIAWYRVVLHREYKDSVPSKIPSRSLRVQDIFSRSPDPGSGSLAGLIQGAGGWQFEGGQNAPCEISRPLPA
jgi:hypothetical protein